MSLPATPPILSSPGHVAIVKEHLANSSSQVVMEPISIYEARNNLSRLIDAALAGEDVTLTKYGTPVVKIVPIVTGGEEPERVVDYLDRVRPWEWTSSSPEDLDAWIQHLREDWDR